MTKGSAQRFYEEPSPRGLSLLGFVAYAAFASACGGVDSEPPSTVEQQSLSAGERQAAARDAKSEVTATKGMKVRVVPMTQRLQKALAAFRHLRGDRVLHADGGSSVTAKVLQKWMAQAQRRCIAF